MIEALRDDMYEKYGMGWDGFEFGQIQILMEQYAAQQVQEECAEQTKNFLKIVDQLNSLENKLAEVTRQRDEAVELLYSICMMLHDGDSVANSHTNDTYIRNKISKTIKAPGFLSQLENEKKDAP